MSVIEWVIGAAVAGVIGTAAWLIFVRGVKTSSTIAQTLWTIMRFTGAFRKNGVRGVFFERADYVRFRRQQTVPEYMATATSRFLYVGYWLAQGLEISGASTTVRHMVERGVELEFILLSPQSPRSVLDAYARFFGVETKELVSRVRASLDTLTAVRSHLDVTKQSSLTIKTHMEFLSFSAFTFDVDDPRRARMLIDTKFYGVERDRTLGLELRPSKKPDGLFERLRVSMQRVSARSMVWPG